MRNSAKLIEDLQSKHNKQFDFIQNLLREKDAEGNSIHILGVRNDYLNIYYLGQSIAKIYLKETKTKTKNENENGDAKPVYKIAHYILTGKKKTKEDNQYKEIFFEEYQKQLKQIKKNAEKNATGNREGTKTIHREKICQQWIMNRNNDSSNSDWYYVDMEYIDAEKPFGRADLVAVKKKADKEGKHQVAIIELKVSNSAYGATLRTSSDPQEQALIDEQYRIIKNNLYATDDDSADFAGYKLEKVKFGSGIVSHIADFLRYLNQNRYECQLRDEIINMIEAYKSFGIIHETNKISQVTKAVQLSSKPVVYILSFTNVPIKEAGNYRSELFSLKTSFYNQLFNDGGEKGSTYCLENMINSRDVDGILSIKEELHASKNDTAHNVIRVRQKVQNRNDEYEFIIKFWDPMAETKDAWDCL